MQTSVMGFPRIGAFRELKFASEKYFRKEIDSDELLQVAKSLRKIHWNTQKKEGIDYISSNDFSLYDLKMCIRDRYMEYLVHRVNGGKVSSSITRAEFIREYENLSVQNPDRIAEILDISKERATQFLPAMMVYKNMIEKTDTEIIWTPGINLCDGMAFDYGEKNVRIKLSHDFSEDILAASRNMAKRFLGNKKHTQMLEELVLRLFDATKKYHGMGKRERLLLQISAILHDCGKYISMATPAECSCLLYTSWIFQDIRRLPRLIFFTVNRERKFVI